jgi:hypothetical protein
MLPCALDYDCKTFTANASFTIHPDIPQKADPIGQASGSHPPKVRPTLPSLHTNLPEQETRTKPLEAFGIAGWIARFFRTLCAAVCAIAASCGRLV